MWYAICRMRHTNGNYGVKRNLQKKKEEEEKKN